MNGTLLAHVKIYFYDAKLALENDPLAVSLMRNLITPWERHSYLDSPPPFKRPILNVEHLVLHHYFQLQNASDVAEASALRKWNGLFYQYVNFDRYNALIEKIKRRNLSKIRQLQVGEIFRLAKSSSIEISFDDFWHHLLFAGVALGKKEAIPTFYMEARTPAHRQMYKFYLETDDITAIESEKHQKTYSWRLRQTYLKLASILSRHAQRSPAEFSNEQLKFIRATQFR